MPLSHLLGLTVITNVENIEALLEVQKLSESLEVHQQVEKNFLINDHLSRNSLLVFYSLIDWK
jgi:hypothetical protein